MGIPEKVPDAAAALKMTADDLLDLGVIDRVFPNRSAAPIASPEPFVGWSEKR